MIERVFWGTRVVLYYNYVCFMPEDCIRWCVLKESGKHMWTINTRKNVGQYENKVL